MKPAIFITAAMLLLSQRLLAQNVGIGTSFPGAQLEVNASINSLILVKTRSYNDTSGIAFRNQTGSQYTEMGMLLQRESGLRIYSESDLGANTRPFIMHISAQGNVGIGSINNSYRLTLNGNQLMQFANGIIPTISFSRSNATLAGSVGMENDDFIGFYGGNGAGWGFGMQVFNGALKIGGSTGIQGQALISQGSNAKPLWKNVTPTFITYVIPSPLEDIFFVTENFVRTDIPYMSISFTLTQTSTVIVSAQISVFTEYCGLGCSVGDDYYYLRREGIDDANQAGRYNQRVLNTGTIVFTPYSEELPAGSYKYIYSLMKRSGSKVGLGGAGYFTEDSKNNVIHLQIFPKN